MDVLKDMLFRQLQWLEVVLAEIPEDKLKTTYAVMVQERIVELHKILFESQKYESNLTHVVSEITRLKAEIKESKCLACASTNTKPFMDSFMCQSCNTWNK